MIIVMFFACSWFWSFISQGAGAAQAAKLSNTLYIGFAAASSKRSDCQCSELTGVQGKPAAYIKTSQAWAFVHKITLDRYPQTLTSSISKRLVFKNDRL